MAFLSLYAWLAKKNNTQATCHPYAPVSYFQTANMFCHTWEINAQINQAYFAVVSVVTLLNSLNTPNTFRRAASLDGPLISLSTLLISPILLPCSKMFYKETLWPKTLRDIKSMTADNPSMTLGCHLMDWASSKCFTSSHVTFHTWSGMWWHKKPTWPYSPSPKCNTI